MISRTLMRYHPRIGYTYMPSTRLRVQGKNGGYLVQTNAAGYRSDREFVSVRRDGAFRVVLFGDSQTAGDGAANSQRYSDLIEKAVPGLEIYNYGLSGSGTDQQFLAYGERGAVEHDLLVIGIFVENIRRITRRIVKSRDADGEEVFRAKPYFELAENRLVLCNVPVPKQPWTAASLPKELLPHVYAYGEEYSVFKNPSRPHAEVLRRLAPSGPIRKALSGVVSRFTKFNPVAEYDSPDTVEWTLMRKILTTWIAESPTPVLVLPLPHDSALRCKSDPSNYQARFRELAMDTGCQVYDPLPELLELDEEERTKLWSEEYGHLSIHGHEVMARLLTPRFERLTRER